ncbi:hypothetical protein MSSIH_3522 [Methanosarcina siciliae HI350]|uniref:Uncharacterized protein n=1 Tax=Methanosarcina siciliae HI350 TaxID=1434119 RepID=A0A0E3PHC7_9EURY|nr:hypothetical protein [Methanosarcina siciliae]AKB34212.1 hypothetical protein MSSIH_3522 [Methanosarcina siciliae HI350]
MITGILKPNTSKPADPESRLILKAQKSVRIKSRKTKSNRALLPPKVRKILKPKKIPRPTKLSLEASGDRTFPRRQAEPL